MLLAGAVVRFGILFVVIVGHGRCFDPGCPGKPSTFLLATTVVIIWAVTGPYFGYSDTLPLAWSPLP
jgi:hypothetical protein